MLTGAGRSYSWNADNQPVSITGSDGIEETYSYDADGARVTRTRGSVTTIYLGGLLEEDIATATTRSHYAFGGQVIAQRTVTSTANTLVYLHGDHLGSTLILSRDNGTYSGQWYTPWGDRRNGQQLTETSREYTGQKRDDTGLLFYNARYYDPVLAHFVSPDTIVPGTTAAITVATVPS